jgi:hypothetical protein
VIESQEGVEWLQTTARFPQIAASKCWDSKFHTYRYRDFETHKRLPALHLLSFDHSGSYPIKTP